LGGTSEFDVDSDGHSTQLDSRVDGSSNPGSGERLLEPTTSRASKEKSKFGKL
jgi:hypothetical protein